MEDWQPTEEQIEFARQWLVGDTREAFPEMPMELVKEIAARSAPSTARELFRPL